MKAGNKAETVKVAVRVRPMNNLEISKGSKVVVEVNKENNQVSVMKGEGTDEDQKSFQFDYVYDSDSIQRNVYDEVAFPIIESVLEGYNGTIFAYGQTGCGKTHTMIGRDNGKDNSDLGIIPNAFNHIINYIKGVQDSSKKFLVRSSFIEIYNEEVRDLLLSSPSNKKLELREDPKSGLFIKDLSILEIHSFNDMNKLMNLGSKNRHIGETSMNAQSSRSHCIFTVYIEIADLSDQSEKKKIKAGKLNLVDLAGSERQSKTHTTGKALDEAKKINLSLTALSNVINSLVDQKNHIPYRDSKLTRLLQDSLGGNTKTVMIAAVSPSSFNYDETLSTLRYAARANTIKNAPKINEDPKDAKLRQYEEEIKQLRLMINGNGEIRSTDGNFKAVDNEKEQLYRKIRELEDEMTQKIMVKDSNEKSEGFSEYRKKNLNMLNQREKKLTRIKDDDNDLMNDNEYESMNDKTKAIIKRLKKKVKSLESELREVRYEKERDTEDLIISVGELSKESKLYLSMLRMVMKDPEIRKIHELSYWNDDREDWDIQPFSITNKNLKLPNIHKSQAKDWVDNQKQSREFNVSDEVIRLFSNYDEDNGMKNSKSKTIK